MRTVAACLMLVLGCQEQPTMCLSESPNVAQDGLLAHYMVSCAAATVTVI